MNPSTQVTELLNRAARGDEDAGQAVFPLIYLELEKSARALRASLPRGEHLQTNALVHEAYLRIVGRGTDGWESRRQFFFYAARAMRDILVEEARRNVRKKRSGELVPLRSTLVGVIDDSFDTDVLALHVAVEELEDRDPVGYNVVMLRYFAGLEVAEVAEVMGVSKSSIERKWRFIRTWLARQLSPGEAPTI